MTYFSSDLHFAHAKEFIYKPRGFATVKEMNETILKNFNSIIDEDDTLYLLGDLMLGNTEEGFNYLSQLKGHIHIILGNHDTDARIKEYRKIPNIESIEYADLIKLKVEDKKYKFYLSHYPSHTTNIDDHGDLERVLINLYGHTHQKTNFYLDNPTMYHVGVDSHNCFPVEVNDIIKDIKEEIQDCKSFL